MEAKEMVCIVCPMGCILKVTKNDASKTGYDVEGNNCLRGVDYGVKEMTNPTRALTTTVKISDAPIKRLPVRTSGAIPKHLMKQAMDILLKVEVKAPIEAGQVIIKNILDTEVNIIASRTLYNISEHEDCSKVYLVQG